MNLKKRLQGINNTHCNLVDESIEIIYCWKYTRFYKLKVILYNIFTLGLIYLLCYLKKNLFIKIFCLHCEINETDLFQIIDIDKNEYLIRAERENFYKKYRFLKDQYFYNNSKKNLDSSIYIGKESKNKEHDTIVLYFKNNKYLYLESEKNLIPLQFDLSKFKNSEIHELFSNGINDIQEYNYLFNKYGENVKKLKNKSFLIILFSRITRPLSIYMIFSVTFWIYTSFYFYIPISIIFVILILTQSYQKYINYRKIFNENDFKESNKKLSVNKLCKI